MDDTKELLKKCIDIRARAIADLGERLVNCAIRDLLLDNTEEMSPRIDATLEQIRKFDAFSASGKDVPDVRPYNPDSYEHYDCPVPGRVYLSCDSPHKCGLIIESTETWPDDNPHKKEGKWHLVVCNMEYMSDDLTDMELELFDFAVSAGWCDKL